MKEDNCSVGAVMAAVFVVVVSCVDVVFFQMTRTLDCSGQVFRPIASSMLRRPVAEGNRGPRPVPSRLVVSSDSWLGCFASRLVVSSDSCPLKIVHQTRYTISCLSSAPRLRRR